MELGKIDEAGAPPLSSGYLEDRVGILSSSNESRFQKEEGSRADFLCGPLCPLW